MTDEAKDMTGAASVEQAVPFQIGLRLQDERPEYEDRAKRAGDCLMAALKNDPELVRAWAYLVGDTPFAVIVAPVAKSNIIIPKIKVATR